jgi:hypothetical protein
MSEDFLEHIPRVRLLCVAVADNWRFTDSEVAHLNQCVECHNEWKHYLTTIGDWSAATDEPQVD